MVLYRGVEAYKLALRCNIMPVAVWVQICPLLRLLLWLPTMWAQKVDKLDDIKNFQFKTKR